MHEAHAAGVPVAMSSDNTRDQFYAYGDLDMLEVFTQGCRMAHLDRPYGNWIRSVTSTPANAMKLPSHGRLAVGAPADFILFRGRRYSELLSRPQWDRVVVRRGKAISAGPPDYQELDYVPQSIRSGDVPVAEIEYEEPPEYNMRSETRLGRPLGAAFDGLLDSSADRAPFRSIASEDSTFATGWIALLALVAAVTAVLVGTISPSTLTLN